MAIVGTAKNARVVVQAVVAVGGDYQVTLTIRGNKYRFHMSDSQGWGDLGYIYRQPNILLANKNTFFAKTITIEAVDNRLRMWEGTGTFESTAVENRIEAIDSTHLASGTWDLTVGTLVSFVNLDAPSTAGTNMQIQVGGGWKPAEELKINVGGAWKTVAPGTMINIGGAWKTVF